MLASEALGQLSRELTLALGSMGLSSGTFGNPQFVEQSTKEAERIFQGYATAKPSKEDAYDAAREFVRGRPLDAGSEIWLPRHLLTPSVSREELRPLAISAFLNSVRVRS